MHLIYSELTVALSVPNQ